MLVVRKELEFTTHPWVQASYSFPGPLSRAEDTNMDETWLQCSRGIHVRGLCCCGLGRNKHTSRCSHRVLWEHRKSDRSSLGALTITISSKEEITWELNLQDKLLVQSQSVENTWLWSVQSYMGHLYQFPTPNPGSGEHQGRWAERTQEPEDVQECWETPDAMVSAVVTCQRLGQSPFHFA